MNALLELAERCEAATEPDTELDHAIALVEGGWHSGTRLTFVLPFTASFDAAMTLVPEGAAWQVLVEALKRCSIATENDSSDDSQFRNRLPAFISAAALRARAAQ